MNGKDRPKGLGRGLDALLAVTPKPTAGEAHGLFLCPLERIIPQKGQPRQHFDETRLAELAASIGEHGVIEPLVVRRAPGGGERYELIAGERRWRAAQRAGLREVPVVVKDVSSLQAFELALVENVQRADLDPIELAEALDRLLREHGYTHEKLASVLQKDRSTVTNALRLLKLPPRVRSLVVDGRLSEGHARALLGAETEKAIDAIAEKVVAGKLSVRQTEELVRAAKAPPKPNAKAPATKSLAVKDLEGRLSRRLGTRVEVRDRKGKGEVVVSYGSLDELDRVLALIER